ncbi:MAG: HPr family phosphocarrier protein [Eubacteriales bacterium]|nr:HPr family phosphocarrier protein [Eubacteriales bacterium]
MKSFEFVVKNPMGMHAAIAVRLIQEVSSMTSLVRITKGKQKITATKIFAILSLNIRCGDVMILEAVGENEENDINRLEMFCEKHL